MIPLRAGRRLTGVEYDDDETAALIRDRCARWLDDSDTVRTPVFGVRTAKVGLRRRRVGLLHVGAPVRFRGDDVSAAVDALVEMLLGVEAQPGPGEVHVDARLFTRGDAATLLFLHRGTDLDDRPLTRAGLQEVVQWRAVVDGSTGRVRARSSWSRIAGLVVADQARYGTFDDLRRHVWNQGVGDKQAWAGIVDAASPTALQHVSAEAAASAVIATLAG